MLHPEALVAKMVSRQPEKSEWARYTNCMKLLSEISEQSLGLCDSSPLDISYRLRKGVRAVMRNVAGEMALEHIGRDDFYKLPGGGVERGETNIDALNREIQEEAGCAIRDIRPLGIVIEYRQSAGLLQISWLRGARGRGVGSTNIRHRRNNSEAKYNMGSA